MNNTAQVVIAGAGPVGLMLAAELRLGGIEVLVVERRPAGTVGESRAPGINARSMEVLAQRGLADTFRAVGKPLSGVMFSGILLDPQSIDPDWPDALILPQHQTERILAERAVELGTRIQWSTEVTGIKQDQDGVEVQLLSAGRHEQIHTAYLIGCDGGRSTVRKSSGIDFPGLPGETWWVVGDLDLVRPPDQGFGYNDRVGFYQISRTEPDWIRLSVMRQTPPQHPDQPTTLDEIRKAMIYAFGTDYGLRGARWMSRWSDGYRHAATYRDNRVFLAGDAAHIHTPVGGQGLNLGIQDAVNLGWKLAAVLRGDAPDSLLDTYHDERHPAGANALKWSMAQTEVLKPGRRREAVREIFSDLFAAPEATLQLAGGLSGLTLRYPLGEYHPLLGRRIPDLTLTGGTDIFTLLHDARPVLIDLGVDGIADTLAPWAGRIKHVTAEYAPDERGGLWHVPVFGDIPPFEAALVRPDGYIAWIKPTATPFTPTTLTDALTQWVATVDQIPGPNRTEEGTTDMNTIDGTWTMTFTTGSGERTAPLILTTDGTAVTGTYDGTPIQDGRIDNGELTYTAHLTSPFKLKIKCTATVENNTMSGKAKAAMMTIPFTATRTA
ncbi:FAD-dependent monooxygenase [Actinoplanes sp. NPDC089786]|uniref:FAD-dependent monooxygenase n=1 Tax=Actinoplanes sp. NPDC089786 TaxID=3155185 RepID=UPI00343C9B16